MASCAHTTIAESTRGRLEHCSSGDCLRLRFGNAVLELDRDELATVLDMVTAHDLRPHPEGADPSEHALIDIGGSGASFAFTHDEVAELRALLTRAALALAAAPVGVLRRRGQPLHSLHLH